jgi:uncharacterized protein
LAEELIDRAGRPAMYFSASPQGRRELALFALEVQASNLPDAGLYAATPDSWDTALRLLAAVLPDTPSIVVIDELPYLVEDDPTLEATLQKCWDRYLVNKPVLLLLIGSDLAMMESLDSYGRAFHQRGTELVVPPFSPAEVADLTALPAEDAFDAFVVTGGLPLIVGEWRRGADLWTYLEDGLSDPTSALVVSAERCLASELPTEAQARTVLAAIGSGERTFTNIARAAGGLATSSVVRPLELLMAKRLVARDTPLSTRPSKDARYRLADPYLRFWLQFVGPHIGELERGRADLTLARVRRSWGAWRGRAIEPVVRAALDRLLPDDRLRSARSISGFWTRSNDVEVDLVGADRSPVASEIAFVGSIKWLDRASFGGDDLASLAVHRSRVPGASEHTPMVGVSRAGFDTAGLDVMFGAADLLEAWTGGWSPRA